MSSIGKIFVVVNLVLSLLLLGSMGALLNASKSTKDDVDRLTNERSALQAELDQARSEFDAQRRNLETDKRTLEDARNDAEVAKDNAERNEAKLENDNQQLRADLSKLTASFELLQGNMDAKDQRNRELQDIADQARQEAIDATEARRQAEVARRSLEDRIAGFERQISDLQGQLADARADAHKSQMLVEVAQAAGFDVTSVMAMPAIDAVVAEVDNDYNFVILDKGKNHDVQKGFVFDVYRGDQFMGQVRVDEVHDDYATASITLPNGEIRRFDRATTRL